MKKIRTTLSMAVAAGMIMVASISLLAGAASAATYGGVQGNMYCGVGTVHAGKFPMYGHHGTVVAQPEVEAWNGTAWVPYVWGSAEVINTNLQDGFYQLAEYDQSWRVARGYAYAVVYWVSIGGGAWFTYTEANVLGGVYCVA
jgi:hypothetical protein